jgi:hypothetical protein
LSASVHAGTGRPAVGPRPVEAMGCGLWGWRAGARPFARGRAGLRDGPGTVSRPGDRLP